jgi:nucleotide-binding universal stress UspA family protein
MDTKLPIGPFRRILFCTDFSPNADFAFTFAIDAAQRRPGCDLYLLHVVPEVDAQFWKTYLYEVEGVDDKARKDMNDRIAPYLARLPQGVELKVEIRPGRDSHEILAFAKEKTIDLIVMGRQGKGSLQTALFGNVTEKVARKADCAVLIVPLSFEQQLAHPNQP